MSQTSLLIQSIETWHPLYITKSVGTNGSGNPNNILRIKQEPTSQLDRKNRFDTNAIVKNGLAISAFSLWLFLSERFLWKNQLLLNCFETEINTLIKVQISEEYIELTAISMETPKKLRTDQTTTALSIPCHKQTQEKTTEPAKAFRQLFHFEPIMGL